MVVVLPGFQRYLRERGQSPRATVEVEEVSADGKTTVTRRTTSPSLSVWEEAFGSSGVVLLLQIAAAGAAAFVAGAVVQRTLVGDFSFKAVGVELAELKTQKVAEATKTAVTALAEVVQDQDVTVDKAMDRVIELMEEVLRRLPPESDQGGSHA